MNTCAIRAMACMWMSENRLEELVIFLYLGFQKIKLRLSGLCGKYFYTLNCFAGLKLKTFNDLILYGLYVLRLETWLKMLAACLVTFFCRTLFFHRKRSNGKGNFLTEWDTRHGEA